MFSLLIDANRNDDDDEYDDNNGEFFYADLMMFLLRFLLFLLQPIRLVDNTGLVIFTARRRVCLSVCLPVTSRCSTETAKRV